MPKVPWIVSCLPERERTREAPDGDGSSFAYFVTDSPPSHGLDPKGREGGRLVLERVAKRLFCQGNKAFNEPAAGILGSAEAKPPFCRRCFSRAPFESRCVTR